MCQECSLKIYNLHEKCEASCVKKAEKYGVRAVPTIIIDEQIEIEGKPALERLKKVLGT